MAFPAAIRLERRRRHVPSRRAALKQTTRSHAHPKETSYWPGRGTNNAAQTIPAKTSDPQCPSRVKQRRTHCEQMSSGLLLKADIARCSRHVSKVPCVDGSGLARAFFTVLQHWSVQPCVRPFDAVHMTAGHNALRGSGP